MRRRLVTLLTVGAALSGNRALAQNGRVAISLQLSPTVLEGGARPARLQVNELLADPRWAQALTRSFSIRLSYHLEIWRSREGWIDQLERGTEWTTVIQHEPLQDQYKVTQILKSGVEESRFATRDDLDRDLRRPFDVDAVPNRAGTFYYTVKLKITALSDEDMEELERFLAGDASGPAPAERSSIGKGLRKFLLRVAGMPGDELEVRSESFRVNR